MGQRNSLSSQSAQHKSNSVRSTCHQRGSLFFIHETCDILQGMNHHKGIRDVANKRAMCSSCKSFQGNRIDNSCVNAIAFHATTFGNIWRYNGRPRMNPWDSTTTKIVLSARLRKCEEKPHEYQNQRKHRTPARSSKKIALNYPPFVPWDFLNPFTLDISIKYSMHCSLEGKG